LLEYQFSVEDETQVSPSGLGTKDEIS